jgi:hypothetical protein
MRKKAQKNIVMLFYMNFLKFKVQVKYGTLVRRRIGFESTNSKKIADLCGSGSGTLLLTL